MMHAAIPICETYRSVGIHAFQGPRRIAVVKRAIDEVLAMNDIQKLVGYQTIGRTLPSTPACPFIPGEGFRPGRGGCGKLAPRSTLPNCRPALRRSWTRLGGSTAKPTGRSWSGGAWQPPQGSAGRPLA